MKMRRADAGDAEGNDYGDEQIVDERRHAGCRRQAHHRLSTPRSPSTRRTTAIAWKRASPTRANARSSAAAASIATYGSFVVNARPDRYFYQPGEPRRHYGGGARLRFQTGAHAHPRRTLPLELAAARQCGRRSAAHGRRGHRRGWHGQSRRSRSRRRAASYRVRVSARTPEGRDVEQFTLSVGRRRRARAISARAIARRCRSSPIRRRIGRARPRRC